MTGLHSGTRSKLVVIGGVLTIAIADAFSDALGIHVSEEAENQHTTVEIWEATIATFASKFVFAITFLIPIFLLELSTAIIVSLVWGMSVLAVISVAIARDQRRSPWSVVAEHLIIAFIVVAATHYVGEWTAYSFS